MFPATPSVNFIPLECRHAMLTHARRTTPNPALSPQEKRQVECIVTLSIQFTPAVRWLRKRKHMPK